MNELSSDNSDDTKMAVFRGRVLEALKSLDGSDEQLHEEFISLKNQNTKVQNDICRRLRGVETHQEVLKSKIHLVYVGIGSIILILIGIVGRMILLWI